MLPTRLDDGEKHKQVFLEEMDLVEELIRRTTVGCVGLLQMFSTFCPGFM